MEMRRFELKKEQIEFLKEMYPDNEPKLILCFLWKMSRYIGWTQIMSHQRKHICLNQ